MSCKWKKTYCLFAFVALDILLQSGICQELAPIIAGVMDGQLLDAKTLTEEHSTWQAALDIRALPARDQKDAYDWLQQVHKQLREEGIHAVVGHYDPNIAIATEKHGVPYLVTDILGEVEADNIFQILPFPEEISSAFVDVMKAYKWKRIAIIFEEGFGSAFVDSLIVPCQSIDCNFWKLAKSYHPEEMRTALRSIRSKGIQHILCFTTASHSKDILSQGRRLGMASYPYAWLMLELNQEEAGGEILKDLQANVTALTLLKTTVTGGSTQTTNPLTLAGLSDALECLVFVRNLTTRPGKGSPSPRQIGHRMKMKRVMFTGKTGEIHFSDKGRRTNIEFNIYNYGQDEFRKVGSWQADHETQEKRLSMTTPDVVLSISSLYPLLGKSVKVVSILEKPFFMEKNDHEDRTGNDRFEGFAVDMMEEISHMLGFTYEMYVVPDGNFGIKMDNDEWNGMIGEILNGNASMTMAPLSINAMREDAIDFTKPFKTRGITVLMKTPEQQSSFFQFLKPLSMQVWFCTLLAIVVISLVLVGLEHYCKICRSDMPKLNLKEGFWFIIGSVVSGSTESTPVTVPGRILTSAWWFFALILVSTYTANLAAFLTVKKIHPPISDVTDLSEQAKIKFGTVRNSGVMTFFKNTQIQPFAKMWTQMNELIPDSMVNTTTEGFQRVKEGNYAFLWDSSVTSYYANVDCDFTEIGPPFDPKGFGMGTPPGAPYTEALSLAILKLGDSGKIAALEDKYWGQGDCPDLSKPSADETAELQLENVAGIFFVLMGGIIIALLAFVLDRLLQWRQSFNVNNVEKANEVIDMQQRNGANNAMTGFI